MPRKSVQMTISLSPLLVEKLDKACEETSCSRSGYIAMALRSQFNADSVVNQIPELISALHDAMFVAKLTSDSGSSE